MLQALYLLVGSFITYIVKLLGIKTAMIAAFISLTGLMITLIVSAVNSVPMPSDSFTGYLLSSLFLIVPSNAAVCISLVTSAHVMMFGYKYVRHMQNMLIS